jgi:hypothetical protein
MKLSDMISVTAELCDDYHRPSEGYYSEKALQGFVEAVKDLASEYPEVLKSTLLEMRTTFKGKLTPMDVRVRVTEKVTAASIQASNDAEKKRREIPNPTGRTYINRTGSVRPVAELPEMLESLYGTYQYRMKLSRSEIAPFKEWIEEAYQANLKKAIADNPDIIPAGWEPNAK